MASAPIQNSAQDRAGPASWTTRALLKWIGEALAAKGVESSRLCAELLLAHVIGCDRMRLYMEADRPATPLERDHLRDLVSRALRHEPVQYLVGEGWFFSLPFHVDKRVLIPRPSSETIVEHILQHARTNPGFAPGGAFSIADVCTGSGCLAVALLKNLAGGRAVATDLSEGALEVAKLNAERHGVADRLDLVRGDLLTPLEGHPAAQQLHYFVSNPPYIPDAEWENADPALAVGRNVKGFEPEMALRGGADGLDFVRPLLERGPQFLRMGGLMLIEVAASRADEAAALASANPALTNVRILKDVEGFPRVVIAERR